MLREAVLLGLLVLAATAFLIASSLMLRSFVTGAISNVEEAGTAIVAYAFKTNPVVILIENRGTSPVNINSVTVAATVMGEEGPETVTGKFGGQYLPPGHMIVRVLNINETVTDVSINVFTDRAMYSFTGYPPPDKAVFIVTPDKLGNTYEVVVGNSRITFTLYEYAACAVQGAGGLVGTPVAVATAVARSPTEWDYGFYTISSYAEQEISNISLVASGNGTVTCRIESAIPWTGNVALLRGIALATPGMGGYDLIAYAFANDTAPAVEKTGGSEDVYVARTKVMVPVIDSAMDAWFFLPSAAINAPPGESHTLGYYYSGVVWLGYVVQMRDVTFTGTQTSVFKVKYAQPYPVILVFSRPYVTRS